MTMWIDDAGPVAIDSPVRGTSDTLVLPDDLCARRWTGPPGGTDTETGQAVPRNGTMRQP
jgi:hypothetical protein